MPKAFSESEKQNIQNNLLNAAEYCLNHYGVKKTTVDEIVRLAGIPKGTFYLFYKSKEILLFNVISNFHNITEQEFLKKILHAFSTNSFNQKTFTEIIISLYKMMEKSFFPLLMKNNELDYLMHKLPDDVLKNHHNSDSNMIIRMFSALPISTKNIDKNLFDVIGAAFRIVFLSFLYKKEIGQELYEPAQELLISSLCSSLWNSFPISELDTKEKI